MLKTKTNEVVPVVGMKVEASQDFVEGLQVIRVDRNNKTFQVCGEGQRWDIHYKNRPWSDLVDLGNGRIILNKE